MTHDAAIVSTARTAIGTAFKGSLVETDALDLATRTLTETVSRSGLDPALIDDVVLGESLYGGGAIGRYAAVAAGLEHVPGVAQNRHCASGLATVQTAAASIIAGMDTAVVAGGVQSSSTMPLTNWRNPATGDVEEMWISPSHPATPDAPDRDMTITVGHNAAVRAGITREEMDEWALRSHERAVAGNDNGSFVDEIFAIDVTKAGETFTFAVDEHPRRGSTIEKLASLKPIHPEIEGFEITAGNSAGLNDGAAAMLLAERAFAEQHGLDVLATVRGLGIGRGTAGRDRTGADPGDSQGPRADRPLGRRHRPLGDQRSVRLGPDRRRQGARPRRGAGQPAGAAAAASGIRSPRPGPAW